MAKLKDEIVNLILREGPKSTEDLKRIFRGVWNRWVELTLRKLELDGKIYQEKDLWKVSNHIKRLYS